MKKLKFKKAESFKQQAGLTGDLGYCKIIIERYIMNEGMENLREQEIFEERSINPLIRIANAMEEILRLVKKDMEKYEEKKR